MNPISLLFKAVVGTCAIASAATAQVQQTETVVSLEHPGWTQRGSPAKPLEFHVLGGTRRDHVEWNIAADYSGGTPDILSELIWSDLEAPFVGLEGDYLLSRRWRVGGLLRVGSIVAGSNRDSDYMGDHRTREFSRSVNGADSGSLLDLRLRASYMLTQAGSWRLSGRFGASVSQQYLRITDGYQAVATPGITPPVGAFDGLHSTYDTTWAGGWGGLGLDYRSSANWWWFGHADLHAAAYYARANWNLRHDFQHPVSFEHLAPAVGVELGTSAGYAVTPEMTLTLGLTYRRFLADDGYHTVHFANGQDGGSQLNEVHWESYEAAVGLAWLW
jgi:hypothetical protein